MFDRRRWLRGLVLGESRSDVMRGRGAGRRLGGALAVSAALAGAGLAPGIAAAQEMIPVAVEEEQAPAGEAQRPAPAEGDAEWLASEGQEGQAGQQESAEEGTSERRDFQIEAPKLGRGARISMPAWGSQESDDARWLRDGGIAIPANARMPGDVRYIEVPADEGAARERGAYYYDDEPYGIRGFVTTIRDPHRKRRFPHRPARTDPIEGGLTPADEVFRRAQLRFHEASTLPNPGRSERNFSRQQFRFHEASRAGAKRAEPTRRAGKRPRVVGEAAVAPE